MSERKSLPVRNPRTGETDYFLPDIREEAIADLCATLRNHQEPWQALGVEGRVRILARWEESLRRHKGPIIDALGKDTGRHTESVLEFEGVLGTLARWMREAPRILQEPAARATAVPFVQGMSLFDPYPLVGVISPWNFPLLLSFIDTIPALVAGAAVAVKPSELTPRFVDAVAASIAPIAELKSVLSLVQGGVRVGGAIVENVDLVCFTGSAETGIKVGRACARRLIPCNLELGGKDPAIVLASANLENAVNSILWGSVVNCGHSCMSIERVYVARSLFEPFVERIVAQARRLRLAWPEPQSGEIGPIIAQRQAEIIRSHLADAVENGATILCGGEIEHHGGGLWCRPTVLVDVHHEMDVMRDETFGPVIPIMPFDTDEEAIALANDSAFGLSAAVFAGNLEEAAGVARRLRAGAISLNDTCLTGFVHDVEKISYGRSGLGGSRMGPAALLRFVRKKALLGKTGDMASPWWFHRS